MLVDDKEEENYKMLDWLIGGVSTEAERNLRGPACLEYRTWKVIL